MFTYFLKIKCNACRPNSTDLKINNNLKRSLGNISKIYYYGNILIYVFILRWTIYIHIWYHIFVGKRQMDIRNTRSKNLARYLVPICKSI